MEDTYLLVIVIVVALVTIAMIVGWQLFAAGAFVIVGGKGSSPRRTRSEANVIRIFERLTGKRFNTVHPKWLTSKKSGHSLELDGYNEELKIAVEFSGPLHTKWYPNEEPYERYFERILRDRYKLERCKEMGVSLIVVDMRVPLHHLTEYVRSRLYDVGYLKTKPPLYIDEQVAVPYVNEFHDKMLEDAAKSRTE